MSRTSKVSSAIVRFFESGHGSVLLGSAEKTDRLVSDKIASPIEKHTGINRRFFKPARDKIASFFAKNRAFSYLHSLKDTFLNMSLRSVGVFFLTFGIYSAAVFLLRRYISDALGNGTNIDPAVAAVTLVFGLFLVIFGDKSLLYALSGGKITGRLIDSSLGISESSLYCAEKGKSVSGIAFLLGSVTGVFTLLVSPGSMLIILFSVVAVITIFNVPEFGLLSAIGLFSFVDAGFMMWLTVISTASYLFKCIRLKRNLRFGTADVLILASFVLAMIFGVNGGIDPKYSVSFFFVYFLAKNLICSKRLIAQAFNVLCLGISVGLALWLLGEYSWYIPDESLRAAAGAITGHIFGGDTLALICVPAIPMALSRISVPGKRPLGLLAVLLIAGCTVVNGEPSLYVFNAVSVLLYFAIARKAPAGALIAGVLSFPFLYILLSTGLFGGGFTLYPLSFEMLGSGSFVGIVTVVLFTAAALLVFQRASSRMRLYISRLSILTSGAVAASVVSSAIVFLFANAFADSRSLVLIWFVLGIAGGIFGVYGSSTQRSSEVYG